MGGGEERGPRRAGSRKRGRRQEGGGDRKTKKIVSVEERILWQAVDEK